MSSSGPLNPLQERIKIQAAVIENYKERLSGATDQIAFQKREITVLNSLLETTKQTTAQYQATVEQFKVLDARSQIEIDLLKKEIEALKAKIEVLKTKPKSRRRRKPKAKPKSSPISSPLITRMTEVEKLKVIEPLMAGALLCCLKGSVVFGPEYAKDVDVLIYHENLRALPPVDGFLKREEVRDGHLYIIYENLALQLDVVIEHADSIKAAKELIENKMENALIPFKAQFFNIKEGALYMPKGSDCSVFDVKDGVTAEGLEPGDVAYFIKSWVQNNGRRPITARAYALMSQITSKHYLRTDRAARALYLLFARQYWTQGYAELLFEFLDEKNILLFVMAFSGSGKNIFKMNGVQALYHLFQNDDNLRHFCDMLRPEQSTFLRSFGERKKAVAFGLSALGSALSEVEIPAASCGV